MINFADSVEVHNTEERKIGRRMEKMVEERKRIQRWVPGE